ncbi:Gfo/Idh/MocA family protein [Olleya namhaensis]|uniref:Predicted dehydrogenase n=1 Tax=Olleya namhaensis TaxID=1144750 RepID=A0A1I3JP19_9FLAO|nr:Gfo/Idh/MocA family oxidoreductase [Olleya namhaensis]SFI61916.1 Predicted dehydrogenase [Olleya namhaensis]
MKVALIGYGDWAKLLEKYLEASNDFDLLHIYSRSIKNHPKGTTNIDVILNKQIEAVFIAVPIVHLENYTRQFLNANKHVFCEKPLTTNPEVVTELFTLAKKQNVALYVNYIYTQSPSINYLKCNLGKVGKIKALNFNLKQFGKFYDSHNAFEILGCHLFAVYFFFFEKTTLTKSEIIFNNQFENKTMHVSVKNKDHIANFTADLLSVEKQRSIQIIGDKGMLYFSPLSEQTIYFYKKEADNTYSLEFVKSFEESNNITNALNYFSNSIKNNEVVGNRNIAFQVSQLLNKTMND